MFGMGSKKPAAGKPERPKAEKKPARVAVTIQLDAKQRDKLALLGGDAWIRDQIDKARFESVFE